MRNYLVCLFIFMLFLLPPVKAAAQQYVFEEGANNTHINAQLIQEADKLHYLFAQLGKGSDTADYYLLDVPELSEQFVLEIYVPQEERFVNFTPSLIVTDPNIKQMQGAVPFGFPSGLGGRVFTWNQNSNDKKVSLQAFTSVWEGPKTIKDLSENKYLIAVFDPKGQGGRYVLKFGSKKSSDGVVQLLQKVFAYLRIKLQFY